MLGIDIECYDIDDLWNDIDIECSAIDISQKVVLCPGFWKEKSRWEAKAEEEISAC